jgi:cytoskeletal protein RodZ
MEVKNMKRPMLILLLTFIAAVGMTGAASAQLIDINLTLGPNVSLLSPTQNQTQDQAQAQTQVSTITNTNNLTNANTNVATSASSSVNTYNITNTNTFNPVIVNSNSNSLGAITIRSLNLNY